MRWNIRRERNVDDQPRHTAPSLLHDRFAHRFDGAGRCCFAGEKFSNYDNFLTPVADGDYAHFGQVALASQVNGGDIANIGVIVGQQAVAVVDTGGSVKVGQELLAAIRGITNKPVRYVINTHEHPDHIFGNAAFSNNVTFVGHHNLPAEMFKRGEYYLHSFRDILGPEAIEQVRIVAPTLLVADQMTLDLGDRRVRLTAWSSGRAHGL